MLGLLSMLGLFHLTMSSLVCATDTFRSGSSSNDSSKFAWDDNLNFEAIEQSLAHEKIKYAQPMGRFLEKEGKKSAAPNGMKLIVLESGIKAVFKPGEYAYGEVAGYNANKTLSQRLVPPTVMRMIDGEKGSLQFYVESSVELRKNPDQKAIFNKVPEKDLCDMKMFYYVFGQWDGHAGNQIIAFHNGKAHLALIDNGGILHMSHTRYGGYSFIEKGVNEKLQGDLSKTFPFDRAIIVKRPTYELLKDAFLPYVPAKNIRKMLSPNTPIIYCIWRGVLWVEMYRDSKSIKPIITKRYYRSSIEAYKKLDRDQLQVIWSDWLAVDPKHAGELIELTLERRDQILNHAYSEGTIIDDMK